MSIYLYIPLKMQKRLILSSFSKGAFKNLEKLEKDVPGSFKDCLHIPGKLKSHAYV